MLLSYRDPRFWEKFHAKHWVTRKPTVLRRPFKEFPFSDAALHEAIAAFEAGLRNGEDRAKCLVSIGDKETAPRRPLKQLFRHDSDSMDRLEENIARTFEKKRFGLMVTDFHTVHSGIWDPITSFIQDARHTIDFPVPRAFLDLFYGNYLSNFTGVHKDTQEIFAFVVRGKKRMLAWPFDYFLPKVKGLSPGAKYFHMRLDVDYRKYRKDAIVLEAEAGDVFYWPSDHWHVAEPQPGGAFSGMVSLGLFRPEFTLPAVKDQAEFRKRLLAGKSLKSQDLTGVTLADDAARQLRWVTGFGFELGGPLTAKAPAVSRVVKTPNCLLLWKAAGGRLVVAANGQSLSFSHPAKLTPLLENLARGKKVSVPPRPGRSLVDWLLRVHAVVPA